MLFPPLEAVPVLGRFRLSRFVARYAVAVSASAAASPGAARDPLPAPLLRVSLLSETGFDIKERDIFTGLC